jgi:acetate kinase
MSQTNQILVANIGTTSFKFRLFEMPSERLLARGGVERIGSPLSPWKIQVEGAEAVSGEDACPDHAAAFALAEKHLIGKALGSFNELAAFGFKPVGARNISGTQVLGEPVLEAMEALYSLFPAHNPPYVAGVRACHKLYPHVPCIGTFETAFYDNVPLHNRRFPVPLEWEEKYGIRRYGFHGASHRYITQRSAELVGTTKMRLISCHMGGSSSIAAVKDGIAVDSSWGMTPQSGLPQNNRVGDFDVFAFSYLARECGLGLDKTVSELSKNAGLKGMSGLPTGDIRDLHEARLKGNQNAQVALDVFVGAVRKYLGQFLVELDGADVLAFTGGIGENDDYIRENVCANLDFCGLKLDNSINTGLRGKEAKISAKDSKIQVWVIPTNEELIIARFAWAKLNYKI